MRGNGTMAWRRMAIGLFTGGPRKMYLLVKRHLMLITTFLCLNGAMAGGGGCLPALLLSTRRAFPILTQLHSLRSTSSPNVWHRYPKERYPKEIYCHNAQSFNKARDLPVPSTSDHGAVLPFEPDLRLPCGVRRRSGPGVAPILGCHNGFLPPPELPEVPDRISPPEIAKQEPRLQQRAQGYYQPLETNPREHGTSTLLPSSVSP